ncbi:unnamed protein product [Rotaria sp. Silwood2]|nr:unnamed protein product [Rotaria sp. Silwood2]
MTAKEDLVEPIMGNGQQTTSDTNDQQQTPPDYQTSIKIENEDDDTQDEKAYDENGEPKFPNDDLLKLEEQVNRVRWIVPVLSDGELIKCLRATVCLAREKIDTKCEPCQRFIRDSIVISFTKIFCDDAVQSWKYDIYVAIYKNAMKFIELCVLKIDDDCFPLLDILSFIMNPLARYHQANNNRSCSYRPQNETEPFATIIEHRFPQRGWLVDFINRFGDLGGFDKLLTRFTSTENKLTISVVIALLKPWGLCYEYLSQSTIKKYFAPIIEFVPQYLNQLAENDFKVEAKTESKSDTLAAVIKWLRHLASRLSDCDKACRDLDELRLKMILRLLQTNSFSGKMNALNEVHKLIPSLSPIHRSTLNRSDDNEGLTPEKFIKWIEDHEILDIVLRDCLHQPQYVEKLERILRFMIKEQALSRNDLAKIWNASCGKHEAIEKNVHDLLAKLAWDFSPEQLEQLFDCFRESWTKASKKQREKLLELIRRLAEDDKEGLMANKIFSQKHEYYQFLIEISDMGCKENNIRIRDTAREILDLVPVDNHIKVALINCIGSPKSTSEENFTRLKNFYFHASPTQMLYNLKTTFIKLVPALPTTNELNEIDAIYVRFLNAGGLICLLNILTHKQLTEQCDIKTRKSIYLIIFYMLKRFLIILGFYQLKTTNSSIDNESLDQILSLIPMSTIFVGDHHPSVLIEKRIAILLYQHMEDYPIPKNSFLQYNHIIDFMRLIWCLASNNKQISCDVNLKNDFNLIHQTFKQENINPNEQFFLNDYSDEDTESQLACRECLELLCLSISLVPSSVEQLLKENFFEYFLIDLILYCHYPIIRHTASEQILILTTRCSQGQTENLLKYLIDKQFQIFNKYSNNLKIYSSYSSDFFFLLCRLLTFAYQNQILPLNIEQQLDDEILWLKNIQLPIDDNLLRGHLNLARDLLQFQISERKHFYGIDQLLIQQIIEQFLFPASTLLYQFRSIKQNNLLKQTNDNDDYELKEPSTPFCQTPISISAAFDLLVILGTNCIENLKLIDKYITDLFYSGNIM